MRVAITTLGCKLNQAESELSVRQFTEAGHSLVSRPDEAELYILNTCTVTGTADSKSRHLLRLAHRRNPDARLVAIGCYAERAPHELAQIDGVTLVVGNNEKQHLLQILRESGDLNITASHHGVPGSYHQVVSRTRAFVKVQDGCNSFCSYCIVPLVRGRERSLPASQVVAEVKNRVASGYKEVVLTGTKIGSYNHDGIGLKELLKHILSETDIARLRLSSLQPQEISEELIQLWSDGRLCPHFHLSLQSGSDAVLNRMRRSYTFGDYERALSLIRTSVPEAAITTDVIVGFPGETDEEFEQTYGLCKHMGFARIHVFRYSSREGTEAAHLPQSVGSKIKKQGSQQMLALAEEVARNFRQRFSGKNMTVLWEKQSGDGVWSGLTGNYIKVYTRSNEDLSNKLQSIKLA
jgi:threonylcarbamoyladenosine tRNA methylthiotransferase MtaB